MIRITNCNHNQITEFGALRSEPFFSGTESKAGTAGTTLPFLSLFIWISLPFSLARMSFVFYALFWVHAYPKDPAVLKTQRVVNLPRVVNLLSHCDLPSRRTLFGHHFPGNYRHFPSRRRVHGVVNMGGGVVKTLRRSNSQFLLSSQYF